MLRTIAALFRHPKAEPTPEDKLKAKYPPGSFVFVDNGVTIVGRYHIRRVTEKGPRLGGGIDTPVLCGQFERSWFDRLLPMSPGFLADACRDCVTIYQAAQKV